MNSFLAKICLIIFCHLISTKVLCYYGHFVENNHPIKLIFDLNSNMFSMYETQEEPTEIVSPCLSNFSWKDLYFLKDIDICGHKICLTDCDNWSKVFLAKQKNASIKDIPSHQDNKEETNERSHMSGIKFKEILKFFGVLQDYVNEKPVLCKVILQFYLSDETIEVLENQASSSGQDACKVIIKKQKIPVDRNELPETSSVCCLKMKDEDLKWFQPTDFRIGKDIFIFGKKIFLYDCDNFTRHYYKTQLGVEEMQSITVAEKPKPLPPKVLSGTKSGTCDTVLKFKARLISPMPGDDLRRFVISFYPSDDSVTINEESIPNSGFRGGPFYIKDKIFKKQVDPTVRPVYYQLGDFYVGAHIRASGKIFELTYADPYVLTFMNDHPELYAEQHIQAHKEGMSAYERKLEDKIKIEAKRPLLHLDVSQHKKKISQEFYSANHPLLQQPLIFRNENRMAFNLPSHQTLNIQTVFPSMTQVNRNSNIIASLQKDEKLPIVIDRGSRDPENFDVFSPIMTPRPQNHPPLKRYVKPL